MFMNNTYILHLSQRQVEFVHSYFECMAWAEDIDADNICEVYEQEQLLEALAFFGMFDCYLSDAAVSQAGHDFWLTRNGHGTGFWDRDDETYGSTRIRDRMNKMAEAFGASDVMVEEIV